MYRRSYLLWSPVNGISAGGGGEGKKMTIQGKPKMAIFGDDGRRHRGDVRVMMLGTSAVREGGNLTIPKEKKMAGFSDDDRLRGGCPSYDDTESMQGVVRTVCIYIYIYIYIYAGCTGATPDPPPFFFLGLTLLA